jgi:molybdate transport system ATP-binding protein
VSAELHFRLNVSYPEFHLDVDLQLPGRGITSLFGPSGSGKTTCLRVIAGLERAQGSYVSVNGKVWQDDERRIFLPTHRRSLGYVFQEASLFTHLNVRRNLEYGLSRVGREATRSIASAADRLGITHLLDRGTDRLSGGERQRVSIARALLCEPSLLLFDEPLASLDAARKSEILPYLQQLHADLDIPSLYVSHSIDEVAQLADHLVVLNQGKAVASGPLQQTLARIDLPATFLERAGVVIDATVVSHDETYHLAHLQFSGGKLLIPSKGQPIGRVVRCRIEASDVSLALHRQSETSIQNLVPAMITAVTDTIHPGQCLVQLDANGSALLAHVTRRAWDALQLAPGKPVWAQVKAVALIG